MLLVGLNGFGQDIDSSDIKSSSKIEIQYGLLVNYGYLTNNIGALYNLNNRINFSIGLLTGFPFYPGFGFSSGSNIKFVSLGKVSISMDMMYKFNGKTISRTDYSDSLNTEYLIPATQFITGGLGVGVSFNNNTNLRISGVYNLALKEYKTTLVQGSEDRIREKGIGYRLNDSFGFHLTFSIPINVLLKRKG
jgi:hypothetical protein